jgi:hypothetical protein
VSGDLRDEMSICVRLFMGSTYVIALKREKVLTFFFAK